MKQQVPDIAPVVAALDRFIITTLDNGATWKKSNV